MVHSKNMSILMQFATIMVVCFYANLLIGLHNLNVEFICFPEGSAVIGVSSLTNRYWTGAIKLYKKTTKDIDSVEFNSIFEVTTDCSVSNVKSLSKTNRIISTFDSGIKFYLHLYL